MVFFDFAAAFPSVAHQWIWIIITHSGLPTSVQNMIRTMYTSVFAYGRSSGTTAKMFPILSGIIQGCPLAGSLFALLLDPFLVAMQKALIRNSIGIPRACADDIGAALSSNSVLKFLYPIFVFAEQFASLFIKPSKTCIVPLAISISPELIITIKEWLLEYTPLWSAISIKGAAKYLGFFLGPAAASHGWNSQRLTWSNRTKAISKSGVPLQIAILAYHSRALSTLSYIAQLIPPLPLSSHKNVVY